jgi:hypothetical protein
MQKASAKKQVKNPSKNKPSKPKLTWRKKVDWSAAGRKAYATRVKNQKKKGKVVKPQKVKATQKKVKPQKKPTTQVKQHGKKKTVGFGNYRVNRDDLIKKLQASKKTEFAPTEIVSLTWEVIKSAKASASANNGRKHK